MFRHLGLFDKSQSILRRGLAAPPDSMLSPGLLQRVPGYLEVWFERQSAFEAFYRVNLLAFG